MVCFIPRWWPYSRSRGKDHDLFVSEFKRVVLVLTKKSRVHFGRTKSGETFEIFLGNGDYDEHLLKPFEMFLNASFSKYCDREILSFNLSFADKEDCDAGALPKGTERDDTSEVESEDEDEEEREEVGGGPSEYDQRRAANIAENKLIFEKIFADSQDPPPKDKLKSVSGTKAPLHEPQRQHEKQSLIDGFFSSPLRAETSSGSANNNAEPLENSECESLHGTSNVLEDCLSVNGQPVSENTNSPSDSDLHDTSNAHKGPSINLSDTDTGNIHGDSSKDMDMANSTLDGSLALSTVNKSCVPDSRMDVDMDLPPDVALAKETRVPEDGFLPTWLVQMIVYL